MKIILNNSDALQLTRAIRHGCLDTDKVEWLKNLVKGYNPPRPITYREVEYYLDCILKGWRIKLPTLRDWETWVHAELPTDLLGEYKDIIENGTLYKLCIKNIYLGLVTLWFIEGKVDHSAPPNWDWLFESEPTF